MSPLLIKISKDLKLARCPLSLAPTLVTLPSMLLIPLAPLKLVCCPRFDSCAPAHIDLSVCPSMSLAPRGSILAPTLVTLPSMSLTLSSIETRSRPRSLTATLAALPSMSLNPSAPFACRLS